MVLLAFGMQFSLWSSHYRPSVPAPPTTDFLPRGVGPALATIFGVAQAGSASLVSSGLAESIALRGTIAVDGEPNRGYAIVSIDGRTELVPAGAVIGDARVTEVYADRILVVEQGRSITISLPRRNSGAGGSMIGGLSDPVDAGPHLPPLQDPPVDEVRRRVAIATQPLGMLLKAEPLLSDEEYRGLVVRPNGNTYLFERAGLRAEDVILGVNGIALTQDNLTIFPDEVRSGRPVKVSLMRPGVGMVEVTMVTTGLYVGPKGTG
jgi:type II secretory pathway component PulC